MGLDILFMAKTYILLKTQACIAKCGCVAASHNILDDVLLVSYFQHWQKTFCTIFTSCSLFGSIFMIFSYIKKIQMGSFVFMFSVLLPFLKIKLLVKTIHRHGHVSFIISLIKGNPTVEYALFTAFHSKQLVNSLKEVTNNTLMKINTCTKLVGQWLSVHW